VLDPAYGGYGMMNNPMRKIFGLFYLSGVLLITAGLLILNLRLYQPGSVAYARPKLGEDVVPQLHFIGASLKAGSGDEMQGIFPEGFFFTMSSMASVG
jgi:hypothetical protein